MGLKSLFAGRHSVFALVTSLSLLVSCSKDLEYKRSQSEDITDLDLPVSGNSTEYSELNPDSLVIDYLLLTKSEPISITNESNVVIENLQFENAEGIALNIKGGHNIIIRNCFFNKAKEEAINIEISSGIRIENCLFNGVTTGVYAMQSQSIIVKNNQFVNVSQRSYGGRGQFVQFNGVSGEGNSIENNKGENFPGESNPEDLISMFNSSGTAESPISIRNNIFRGGGPSTSGGGIMTGDYGGGYQVVENNTLLDPGQYGIASAGGKHITLINNKIFAKQQPFTNNPLYVWAQAGAGCSDIFVKGNRANWINKNGEVNGGWNSESCDNTSFEYPTTITLEEMNVPEHLITMVTPEQLLEIRK
ncbi:MAG: right-handed parallel beta-helix repeat-containing protein [Chitinophagaceae bacterium]